MGFAAQGSGVEAAGGLILGGLEQKLSAICQASCSDQGKLFVRIPVPCPAESLFALLQLAVQEFMLQLQDFGSRESLATVPGTFDGSERRFDAGRL